MSMFYPMSPWHVSSWCPILTTRLAIYQTYIGVQVRRVTTQLGLYTLQHLKVARVLATATHMRGAISRTSRRCATFTTSSIYLFPRYQIDCDEKWDVKKRILRRRGPGDSGREDGVQDITTFSTLTGKESRPESTPRWEWVSDRSQVSKWTSSHKSVWRKWNRSEGQDKKGNRDYNKIWINFFAPWHVQVPN